MYFFGVSIGEGIYYYLISSIREKPTWLFVDLFVPHQISLKGLSELG
jgi:hypothetical protein